MAETNGNSGMGGLNTENEIEKSVAEIGRRSEHPLAYLSDNDITEVERRLEQVHYSVRSIWGLASDAIGDLSADSGVEHHLVAIRELARANVMGLDACIHRLTGDRIGNFATEFATD